MKRELRKGAAYTTHSTVPTVMWTSAWLPVSRAMPLMVMRVPPALGPLLGLNSWGIGSWGTGGGGTRLAHTHTAGSLRVNINTNINIHTRALTHSTHTQTLTLQNNSK